MEKTVIEIDGVNYTMYNAKSFYDKLEQDIMSRWGKQLEVEVLEFKTNSERAKEASKYYNPKIEEFYIGFKFERLTPVGEWITDIIDFPQEMEYIKEKIRHNDIRVKFLDKIDVESLGFNYEGINQNDKPVFLMMKELSGVNNLQNIFMTFDKANNTVDIKIVNITDLISYENSTNTMTFKAKNKSELKRILESLNIL